MLYKAGSSEFLYIQFILLFIFIINKQEIIVCSMYAKISK